MKEIDESNKYLITIMNNNIQLKINKQILNFI